MKAKVFVDGQEGTTGLEIHGRLAARSDLEIIAIDPELRKDPAARKECLNRADIAFLCLPDAAAIESVALVENPKTCIIDNSTAHRIAPGWAYGIPELGPEYRKAIRTSNRIANIGCHAAAFTLALRPLVNSGIIPADFPISCFSLTGYSGGGKKLIAEYTASPLPEKLKSPRPYGLDFKHKHLPEMRVHSGLSHAPLFTPVVANFYKGLAVSIPLALGALPGRSAESRSLAAAKYSDDGFPSGLHAAADIHRALAEAYAGEKFVRVYPLNAPGFLDGQQLDIQACNGTNRCDIAVLANGEQAIVIARLDNLGKGASGSAIQNMNLRLGLPEDTGLTA